MIDILENLGRWGPTVIFLGLVIWGIYLGFGELVESSKDMDLYPEDMEEDPRYDVSRDGYMSALKNLGVQAIFILLAVVVTYAKVSDPKALHEPLGVIRSLISPAIMISAEALLVSQLLGIRKTRNIVKDKARVLLKNRNSRDAEANQRDVTFDKRNTEANHRDYKANERDKESNKRDFYSKQREDKVEKREEVQEQRDLEE